MPARGLILATFRPARPESARWCTRFQQYDRSVPNPLPLLVAMCFAICGVSLVVAFVLGMTAIADDGRARALRLGAAGCCLVCAVGAWLTAQALQAIDEPDWRLVGALALVFGALHLLIYAVRALDERAERIR